MWKVAVDFGTSNTHVMVDKNDGNNPGPLTLTGRTTLLTHAPGNVQESLTSGFYPAQDVSPPFATILTQGEATVLGDGAGAPSYTPRFLFYPERAGDQTFVQNLKWDIGNAGAPGVAGPLHAYLHGVARYIACEAWAAGVSTLSFTWSYPLSLPTPKHADMNVLWGNIGNRFVQPRTMAMIATPGLPESDAVCRYLGRHDLLPTMGEALSVAVDVGGGSTDIGFWRAAQLVDQVSFKLAANDLLEPLCKQKPNFAESLYRFCAGNPNGPFPLAQQFGQYPVIIANALLASAGGDQDPRQHQVVQTLFGTPQQFGQQPWFSARSLIYLFFSGLAFHLGLQARKHFPLPPQGGASPQANGQNLPLLEAHLYFGGRGSSLLTWIDNRANANSMEQSLSSAFRSGLTHARSDLQHIQVYVESPVLNFQPDHPPKQEVAGGLLVLPPTGMVIAQPNGTTIVGEEGWTKADGTLVSWDTALTAQELSKLRPPSPAQYATTYIAQFLSHVASPNWLPTLGVDKTKLAQLKGVLGAKMQNALVNAADRGADILQPVFAYELKAIIDEYVRIM